MISFFLAATLYPAVQKKAHEELDRVVGASRLPSFIDQDDLPYITCIAWECLRWLPATPLVLSHQNTEEDVFNGWRIPKGTTVMPNVSCVCPLSLPPRYADSFQSDAA